MSASGQSEATLKKQQKAARYATEPDRFELSCVRVRMTSEHGVRDIELVHGSWKCTCDFFPEHGTCSHIMALEIICREHANLKIVSSDQGG